MQYTDTVRQPVVVAAGTINQRYS